MKKLISTLLIMIVFIISANSQAVIRSDANIRVRPGTERRIHRLELRRIRRMERRRQRRRQHRTVFELNNGNIQYPLTVFNNPEVLLKNSIIS